MNNGHNYCNKQITEKKVKPKTSNCFHKYDYIADFDHLFT